MSKADIAREAGAARARRRAQPQLLRSGCRRRAIAGSATPAGCAPRALPKPGLTRPDALRDAADDLCGQGMLPDPAGGGRAGGQPRGVPALCRVQSVVGPRAGPGARRSAISATPISSAPTATGGGKFADAEALAASGRGDCGASGQRTRLVVVTGGEPMLQLDAALVDALHARGFRVAVESNGTLAGDAGDRLAVHQPQGGDRGRPALGRRAEAGLAAGGDRSRPRSKTGTSTISSSSRWIATLASSLSANRSGWRWSGRAGGFRCRLTN